MPLGVALAIGLTRWRGRTATASRFTAMVPLVTPEIVMGVALLLVFVYVFSFIPLGTTAQAIGHITFSISFVLVIVRGRLLAIGPEFEEAAQDLGASPLRSIRMVLVPMLIPAIVASAIIVFAISMDDFVVSNYLLVGLDDRHGAGADLLGRPHRPDPGAERAREPDARDHDRPLAARVRRVADRALGPRPARLRTRRPRRVGTRSPSGARWAATREPTS